MERLGDSFVKTGVLRLAVLVLSLGSLHSWEVDEPGRSIGNVSTQGNLILLELQENTLGKANLFDLAGRTLSFKPDGSRYRVQSGRLRWDSDLGHELVRAEVALHDFTFPFGGNHWKSFLVGASGSIRFGKSEKEVQPDAYGRPDGGVSLDRFDQLAEVAGSLIERAPAICVFLKPRLSGPRYVKQLRDRVVITWDLTEPFGSLLDFGWFPTVNRVQAVLHRDGTIEMSYKELAARDAIVGVYPLLSSKDKRLVTLTSAPDPALPRQLDVQHVTLGTLDDAVLRVAFEAAGPVPKEGDPAINGIEYRLDFANAVSDEGASVPVASWVIRGMPDPYSGGPPGYFVSGPGTFSRAAIQDDTITIEGILPAALRGKEGIAVSARISQGQDHASVVKRLPSATVQFSEYCNPEVHFSSAKEKDGPFPFVYESFHYLAPPKPQDLCCTVIGSLGDRFDFLAYYSDFRIDSQEASCPSFGPAAGEIAGIGQTEHNLKTFCSEGKFQWAFAQPVYVGANEMQERPPANAPIRSDRDITFYIRQLREASPDRKPSPYNYAITHLGHEIAHRWGAYVSAKVNGQSVSLGPWPHWARELHAPVAFPYSRPTEASTLGGSFWQNNFDGTYTQLHDGYFVPATGYSYLDLYLMGFISAAEVPDFFILKNLSPTGVDANGHKIFKAEPTKITIRDVIAAEGARLPDAERSQRRFNTGIVLLIEHGKSPSQELTERANGIRQQWTYYWDIVTGHRASMTVNPR